MKLKGGENPDRIHSNRISVPVLFGRGRYIK